MMVINNIEKITNFLYEEYSKKIDDIFIFKNDDGSFELFNKYTITKNNNKTYTVTSKFSDLSVCFYILKNAVTWCIFDKRNKITDAKKIKELDQKIDGLDIAIVNHTKLIKKSTNLENLLIYSAKLKEEQLKKQKIITELNEFILRSKLWQTKQFSDKS